MDPFTAIFLFILAVILYKYYSSRRQTRTIPGPKGYPIIGSALQIKPNQMHSQFYDLARKYGPIFEVNIFGNRLVALNSVDVVNKAYNKEGPTFFKRPTFFVSGLINMLDSVGFNSEEKNHSFRKKSFTKGLHLYGNGLPKFEAVVKGEIDRVMKKIEAFNGQEFEVIGLINRSLVNVMSILMIGEEATDTDANLFNEYIEGQDFIMNPMLNTAFSYIPPLIHLPYLKKRLNAVTEAQRKIMDKYFFKPQKSRTSDKVRGITDWLLQDREENAEAGSILTDNAIKSMLLTDVLTGGVVTTSTVIPGIILCLVNHPEYLSKLQEEIDRVIGNKREPTINDRHECPFVEAVAMETMRYIPPLPFYLPHLCSQDTELEGHLIQKDTQIVANIWFIHHDENIWGDPWTFRPERFLDENGKVLPASHPLIKSWLPFGVGRRRCPGMTMASTRIFLYLTSIFQRWTFEPSPGNCGSCDPMSDNFVYNLTFKSKPFHCVAKKRDF